MSPSEAPSPQIVKLQILGTDADAIVTIFDGRDREVWKDRGDRAREIPLPRGLYTVRVTSGAAFQETVVRLDDSMQIGGISPQRFSAAPLAATATTHEYYSETSTYFSRNPTRLPLIDRQPRDSWLLLFVRAVSKDAYRGEDLAEGLEILDGDGAVLSGLGPDAAKVDKTFGWLALSVKSPAGAYRLRYRGEQPREIALHLYGGWQTQVFLMHHERPRFGSMKILMARETQGFHSIDEVAEAVDRALEGLQNNTLLLTDRDLRRLLRDKFENPMLGLVGGHALLMRLAANRAADRDLTEDLYLMRLVLMNLDGLVMGSPDVQALHLAFSQFTNQPWPSGPCLEPPMLRAGLTAILDAGRTRPEIVPEEGVVERIAERVFADTPWTTWGPLQRSDVQEPGREMSAPLAGRSRAAEGASRPRSASLNWLQMAVLDEAERQQRKKSDAPAIVDAERLAQRLGVTRSAVLRAARSIDALGSPEFDQLAARQWEGVHATRGAQPFSALVK